MVDQRSEFRLGIIGGCMSHQAGISVPQLYHQQLAQMLKANDGVRLGIRIARGFELSYRDRLIDLLNSDRLDGVLLHIRITFIRKAGIVTCHASDGVARHVIHPFLFHRHEFGKWTQLEIQGFDGSIVIANRKMSIQNTFDTPPSETRIGRFRLGDLNRIAGMLTGLDKWAIDDELFELAGFNQVCQEKRIPFFVLGPTPCANSSVTNRLCQKMNDVLKAKLPLMKIPFYCIEDVIGANDALEQYNDGIHLTVDGHRFIAKRLHPLIAPWIKAIINGTHQVSSGGVA